MFLTVNVPCLPCAEPHPVSVTDEKGALEDETTNLPIDVRGHGSQCKFNSSTYKDGKLQTTSRVQGTQGAVYTVPGGYQKDTYTCGDHALQYIAMYWMTGTLLSTISLFYMYYNCYFVNII